MFSNIITLYYANHTKHILATGWTIRESNPGGERHFPHLYRPALGLTQPPVQWVPGLSRGERAAGA